MRFVKGEQLQKQMIIGLSNNGEICKDYSLLRSNGIAEKIFTDKIPQKPYTWIANVLAAGVDKIGTVSVGAEVRKQYAETETVIVPPIIYKLSLADTNAMLIELHRTTWRSLLHNSMNICMHCGHDYIMHVDLNKITMLEEDIKLLQQKTDWQEIVIDVPIGWEFEAPAAHGTNTELYTEFKDTVFNRFVFRIPTLADAIKYESLYQDTVPFWRKIATDCLQKILCVENLTDLQYTQIESGEKTVQDFQSVRQVITEIPENIKNIFINKMFEQLLDVHDLREIRENLRDNIPTLPFYYMENCPNPQCRKPTRVAAEVTDFFSV